MNAPVADRIRARIAQQGSIGIDDYMRLALGDGSGDGYYATRDPFGASGDFITAPEVSQLFGEIVGAWCAHMWAEMGRPSSVLLVEPGPGRGTLMADILRVARLVPGFLEAATVHLVETSPALRQRQRQEVHQLTQIPEKHTKDTVKCCTACQQQKERQYYNRQVKHPDGMQHAGDP